MAGRHINPGKATPAATRSSSTARRRLANNAPAFDSAKISINGAVRDSMGTASLMGSSVPKGLFSSAIAAAHAGGLNTLVGNQTTAQLNVATALAGIEVITKSRGFRSAARNAEGIAPTSTALRVEAARLLANGRGPRVNVLGMVAGDVARAVAEFDRYGYTVNRAMVPPRLDPMTSRSFWLMEDPTILGSMPQGDREAIIAAFESGVTIWANVADIGTHTANTAQSGVTY